MSTIKIISFTIDTPIGYLESKIANHLSNLLEDGEKVFSPCIGVRIEITGPNTFSVEDNVKGDGVFVTQKWAAVWHNPSGTTFTVRDSAAEALVVLQENKAAGFVISHIQEVWV